MTFRDYLVRDWGRDAGHAISGILLTVLAYAGNGLIVPAIGSALLMAALARFLAKMQWPVAAVILVAVFVGVMFAPAGPLWAAVVGGTGYALFKEVGDILKAWPKKQPGQKRRPPPRVKLDNVSDLVSYQFGWPLMLGLFVGFEAGALALVGVTAVYLGLVWKKTG